jgi:hypothetical protein
MVLNRSTGVCGKNCAWWDILCNLDKVGGECGGAYWDPLFGVGQSEKELLLQKGFTYAEPDFEGNVVFTTPDEGVGKGVDCAHQCGSLLNPIEWGCYLDKMMGGCGGSTGICDIIGGGEGCLKWGKWVVVVVVVLVLGFIVFGGGRRRR